MGRSRLLPALLLTAGLIFLPACADEDTAVVEPTAPAIEEVETEVEQAGDAIEAYAENQTKALREAAAVRLAELETQIDELEVETEQLTQETQVELQDEIAALRQQAAVAEEQLDQLAAATAENWEQVEPQFEAAMNELENALNQVIADAVVVAEQAGEEVEQEVVEASQEIEQGSQAFAAELEALEAYSFEERAEFARETEMLLGRYDARIDQLEAESAQVDEAARVVLNDEIAELRQQRQVLQQQLDQIEVATAEDWQNLKLGITEAIEDIEQSFKEAESRVG